MKYRLTQARLHRQINAANASIQRLLDRGIVPDMVLRTIPGYLAARKLGFPRIRKGLA